jgi:DNA-binding CsgD family transcriptional regulator
MHLGVDALSEREKDALRLLVSGHDAKSIARRLGLSVHTVNERLRESRRKLGVSSSRAAARLLAEAEQPPPKILADKEMWVRRAGSEVPESERPGRRQGAGVSLAWLGGGMLIMALLIAAVALASFFQTGGNPQSIAATTAAASPSEGVAVRSGLEWLALVDKQQWGASWEAAGAPFKSAVQKETWASTIQSLRQPLGPIASRSLQSRTSTTTLPGAPAGEYEVLQFQTRFARKPDAVEMVVLAHEGTAWKVAGYFLR